MELKCITVVESNDKTVTKFSYEKICVNADSHSVFVEYTMWKASSARKYTNLIDVLVTQIQYDKQHREILRMTSNTVEKEIAQLFYWAVLGPMNIIVGMDNIICAGTMRSACLMHPL